MKTSVFVSLMCGMLAAAGCAPRGYETVEERQTRGMMRGMTEEQQELNRLVSDAADVYQRFLAKKRGDLPLNRLENERACVAVVPNFTTTALGVGVAGGRGIVSCKRMGANSPWSAPAFFTISTTSLGAQLGRQSSEVVTYVIGDNAGESFARGDTFKLGSELDATAGRMGGDIAVSGRQGRVYAMNKQGAFLGLSLSGSSITPDAEANARYYGREASPQAILFENAVSATPEGSRFTSLLAQG